MCQHINGCFAAPVSLRTAVGSKRSGPAVIGPEGVAHTFKIIHFIRSQERIESLYW